LIPSNGVRSQLGAVFGGEVLERDQVLLRRLEQLADLRRNTGEPLQDVRDSTLAACLMVAWLA
jgi:hypothetical protein